MRMFNSLKSATLTASALCLTLGSAGCSTFQPSHIIETEPAVSVNAVASADGALFAQPYTLVVADTIGLATFGQQIVMDDMQARDERLVEAR